MGDSRGREEDLFFEAGDGIRDARESRGRGDVYRRRGVCCALRSSCPSLLLVGRRERGRCSRSLLLLLLSLLGERERGR